MTLSSQDHHSAPATLGDMSRVVPVERRVLVADDSRAAAISLSMLLSLAGYISRTAFDGEEALDVAAVFDPDVVLLDIGLSRFDGYDVCKRVRELPHIKPLAIVALIGAGQAENPSRSFDAGFNAHLVKPVDPDALRQTLRDLSR